MTTDIALMVYSLGGGGVERMRLHLARAVAGRGYSTAIVVARAVGPYRSRIPRGVKLVDLGASSWRSWLDGVTAYLKDEEPRALLAAMETAGVLALWARRRAKVGTRIVVSSHVEISRHMRSERKLVKRIAIPYLMRWLYPSADGIVAVSSGVANDLAHFARLPRQGIRVIYNPVITDQCCFSSKHEICDARLADRSQPLIVGMGRLTEQKDFQTLLRAFSLVRLDRPARLAILGEGKDRPVLETLAHNLGLNEYVDIPGFVDDPISYMARAAVFVLSSAWEGFGNVLVEALADGCPVVSTDCPSGPREILHGGKYGRLVPVGDHEAMAQAILQTLDDPPDPNVLRARAMDFHVDKIVEQYLDVMGLA